MSTKNIKKFFILLLVPLLILTLSACDPEEEISEYVVFYATGDDKIQREVARAKITDNGRNSLGQVEFIIPDETFNLSNNREFVEWQVIRPGYPPAWFDHNNVGDVREVHALFSADASVSIDLTIVHHDVLDLENETNGLPAHLIDWRETILSGQTPITLREILSGVYRDYEPLQHRQLHWFHMDEEGNADLSRPIDLDATRFRFVELRRFVEEGGGFRVIGIHEIQFYDLVIDVGINGHIANLGPGVVVPGIDFEQRGNGIYSFRLPYGQPIFSSVFINALDFRSGQDYVANLILETEDGVFISSGPRAEFNENNISRPMPSTNLRLSMTWMPTPTIITLRNVSNINRISDLTHLDNASFQISSGNLIRDSILINEGLDINDISDSDGRWVFAGWQVTSRNQANTGYINHFTILPGQDQDAPPTTHGEVFLTAIWDNHPYNIDIFCTERQTVIHTILAEWGQNIEELLNNLRPQMDLGGTHHYRGFTFNRWYNTNQPGGAWAGGHTVPTQNITINVIWSPIISNLFVYSEETSITTLLGELDYFTNILEALDASKNQFQKLGHTFGNWVLYSGIPGFLGAVVNYSWLMEGREIVVTISWIPNQHDITFQLYDDSEEAVGFSQPFVRVPFGNSIGDHLAPITAERPHGPVTIIAWAFQRGQRQFTLDEMREELMQDAPLVLFAVLPDPPPEGGVTTPQYNLILRCILFDLEQGELRFYNTNQRGFISITMSAFYRSSHTIIAWDVFRAENGVIQGELIERISLEQPNGGIATDVDFYMLNHEVVLVAIRKVNTFEISFNLGSDMQLINPNPGQPLVLEYGQEILPFLTNKGVTGATRIGWQFQHFTLAGTILTDQRMSASNITLGISWFEWYLNIAVQTAGTGGTVQTQSIFFRHGGLVSDLNTILENNLFNGQRLVDYNINSHEILGFDFSAGTITDDQGRVLGMQSVVFTVMQHSSRVTFESDWDPRRPTENVALPTGENALHLYIPLGASILEYLRTRNLPNHVVGAATDSGIAFAYLGQHDLGGDFVHWLLGEGIGGILLEDHIMTTPHGLVLIAYWARLGQITITGSVQIGNSNQTPLFVNNNGQVTDTITLTGIMTGPDTDIRGYLQRLIGTYNNLEGFTRVIDNSNGLPSVVFMSHRIRILERVQIYGFALVNCPHGINILHSASRVNWDPGTDYSALSIRVLAKQHTEMFLQVQTTSALLDFIYVVGYRITAARSTNNFGNNNNNHLVGDVVFPTFWNGRRIFEIHDGVFGTGGNAQQGHGLHSITSVSFPRYVAQLGRLGHNEARGFGQVRIDLQNLPLLNTIPLNFARGSGGRSNHLVFVIINPVTRLTNIHANAFSNSHAWDAPATSLGELHMRGFEDMTPAEVSWWNIRFNFLGGTGGNSQGEITNINNHLNGRLRWNDLPLGVGNIPVQFR